MSTLASCFHAVAHRSRLVLVILLVLACGIVSPAGSSAQASDATQEPDLTLERIMGHPDWISRPPEAPYWSDDGATLYYSRKRTASALRDLWSVDLASGATRRVEDAERAEAGAPGGDWNSTWTARVFDRAGDVYLKEQGEALRQLTRTADVEASPRFLVGDRRVAFRRGEGNWFVRDLDTGLESLVAELKIGKDPLAEPPADDFLSRGEDRLLDIVRQRRERKREADERARDERREDPSRVPPPFYLGENVTIQSSWLAPSNQHLLVLLRPKEHDEGKRDRMPDFITASGYVEVRDLRPKVGAPKPVSPKLLLLDLVEGTQREVSLATLPGIEDDPLRELREKAESERAARKKAHEGAVAGPAAPVPVPALEPAPSRSARRRAAADKAAADASAAKPTPKARVVSLAAAQWSEDGERLVLDLYSFDNKDRWLAAVELATAKLVPLERITDPAWINWDFREWGFLRDGRGIWFLSEESGWSHLYTRAVEAGGKRRAVTSGRFVVQDPWLARDGASFLVSANREHPGIFEAYRVATQGGDLDRLTQAGGLTQMFPSPQGDRIALLSSTPTRPVELFVQETLAGSKPRRLTETIEPEFAAIRWSEPEVVAVPSRHGAEAIYSRVYVPEGWTPQDAGRWPAVVFVHGAGYLQNVHFGWSSYFREFMFHTWLARHGYVVIDMDFRASAGYGRDWRTAIYRQMGYPEVEDLSDGVAWLVAERGVDPQRVGVYGGSYGGFLAFMAMFREPDLFACGAALRPVSDWAHYNHPYTSNILNTPEVDPEAYLRSSPIEYAEGLRKPLLILHGMVDDNVVFHDSVRLVQRLIELKKTQWFETAIYPIEPHSFVEPASWLDEYTRIWLLMERNLKGTGKP